MDELRRVVVLRRPTQSVASPDASVARDEPSVSPVPPQSGVSLRLRLKPLSQQVTAPPATTVPSPRPRLLVLLKKKEQPTPYPRRAAKRERWHCLQGAIATHEHPPLLLGVAVPELAARLHFSLSTHDVSAAHTVVWTLYSHHASLGITIETVQASPVLGPSVYAWSVMGGDVHVAALAQALVIQWKDLARKAAWAKHKKMLREN